MTEDIIDESMRLRDAVGKILSEAFLGDIRWLHDASWFDHDTLLQERLASDVSNVFRECKLFARDMDAFLELDPKLLRRSSTKVDAWLSLKTLLHADSLNLSPGRLKYHCLGFLVGAFQLTQQLGYCVDTDVLEARGLCAPRPKHNRYWRTLLDQTIDAFGRLGYGSPSWARRMSTELCNARASTTEVLALLQAFGELVPADEPNRLFGEVAYLETAILDLIGHLTRLTLLSGGLLNELSGVTYRRRKA